MHQTVCATAHMAGKIAFIPAAQWSEPDATAGERNRMRDGTATANEAPPASRTKVLREAVNTLLIRWHRWSADPSLSTDMTMRQFDEIVAGLKPCFRLVLVIEARNLACGHAVWSSVRAGNQATRARARWALHRGLAADQDRWFGREIVKYNARGNRIGESNPNATLTDHEIDLLREMREERKPDGSYRYSLGFLAAKFKVPKASVQSWCDGRRRAQTAAEVREVVR